MLGEWNFIKSVLFSLQTYWASIFVLPKSVTKKVHQLCKDFLWGGAKMESKIPLASWDSICRPKKQGGLNIINCVTWNIAAVSNQIWNLASKDNLWVKWVNGVYLKGVDFLFYSPK